MRRAGRIQAAIDVLTEVTTRHRPAAEALKDWGRAHRFAGSADRHAIGTLVYDALRHKLSAAARMGDGRPRALVLAVLRDHWGITAAAIAAAVTEPHGPGALSEAEAAALARDMRADLPEHVAGDFPEWLMPEMVRAFGERAGAEGAALSSRAPIDLRVNTLKATRDKALAALARFGAVAGPLSPLAIRIAAPGPEQKHINVEADPAHGLGWFEVQDAGSQVAALMSGAKAGEAVADICAGAGGKTLALAALMDNTGRLVATDADRFRLRPIFERLTRSGASVVDVVAAEDASRLAAMGGFDRVVVDAPCSGSGSWRRKPDAKWRLSPKQLEERQKAQRAVLAQAAGLVKRGGTLTYITCSVLPSENTDQVAAFLSAHEDFKIIPYAEQWRVTLGGEAPVSADGRSDTLLLTPVRHGTDGFFIATLQRKR